MKPTTTLIVTSSWPRTGDPIAGTFVRTDASARARRGERVIVAAPEGPGLARGGEGLRVIDVAHGGLFGSPGGVSRLRGNPLKIVGISRFVSEVNAVVEATRPDVIVAHWIVPGGVVAAFASTKGVEREIVAHGGDVRLLEALPRAVARRIVERVCAGAVLRAVSASLAERIARIAPSIARSMFVSPMPLATDDARVLEAARARGEELRSESVRPLHVVASRLVKSKPVERVVDHVARSGGRLVIVGDGPTRASLADRAARSRVDIDLLGARPHEEALAWIAAADVLLAPIAHGEGNPTVVREARALGTPVVVLTP